MYRYLFMMRTIPHGQRSISPATLAGMPAKEPRLVQITTADGLTLPGLFYATPRSKKVAIHLHGNGSSSVFYDDGPRSEQAAALSRKGISFLVFNNRGAHLIKRLTVKKKGTEDKKNFGMAYEKIKDCIKDIDAAISFLKEHGYQKFYLIGESTGANKICVYDHYRPRNPIAKYILLGGGDDTGSYYDLLGKKKFLTLLKKAKQKSRRRHGEDIMTELLPDALFSYQSFYDIANPDGDYNVFPFLEKMKSLKLSTRPLFRMFKALHKPTLVVYGEQDQFAWGDVPKVVSILKEQQPAFTYNIIKGADHSFSRHQPELAKLMTNWLST
jgi:pimeloyl-ACP methyl ester carboxylesterase